MSWCANVQHKAWALPVFRGRALSGIYIYSPAYTGTIRIIPDFPVNRVQTARAAAPHFILALFGLRWVRVLVRCSGGSGVGAFALPLLGLVTSAMPKGQGFKLPPGLGWPTQEPTGAERHRQQELQERQAREAIRGIRARLSSALGPLFERRDEFKGGAIGVGCGVVRVQADPEARACTRAMQWRVQQAELLRRGWGLGSPARLVWTG